MPDYLSQPRREFAADEGTFLLNLRGDRLWDKPAFSRLEKAMRWACELFQGALQRAWLGPDGPGAPRACPYGQGASTDTVLLMLFAT